MFAKNQELPIHQNLLTAHQNDSTPMNEEDPANIPSNIESTTIPSSPTTESPVTPPATAPFENIDRRSITLGRITGLILAFIVLIGVIAGLFFMWVANGFGLVWGIAAAVGISLATLLLISGFFWPVWEYNCTSWRLNETGLEIHHGVFWQHRTSVPVARVQHADVSQGPLQRRFELGKLTVHTAGTQNASVELSGIAHDVAVELRNRIVSQRKSSDVV